MASVRGLVVDAFEQALCDFGHQLGGGELQPQLPQVIAPSHCRWQINDRGASRRLGDVMSPERTR